MRRSIKMDLGVVRGLLERNGRRWTRSRLRVVEEVLRRERPFTAEDLRASLPSLGRATVYRTLRLLTDLGVVCKVVREDGSPRYRLGEMAHHHHLVCLACGRVEDVARCAEDLLEAVQDRTGFRLLGHRVEVYGLCPACQGKGG